MVSAHARRSQVGFASHRGISVRRACALIGVARSTMGYEPKMPAKDGPVVTAMRELSSQYPRFGYRRIHIFLGRRGHEVSPDRAHRFERGIDPQNTVNCLEYLTALILQVCGGQAGPVDDPDAK